MSPDFGFEKWNKNDKNKIANHKALQIFQEAIKNSIDMRIPTKILGVLLNIEKNIDIEVRYQAATQIIFEEIESRCIKNEKIHYQEIAIAVQMIIAYDPNAGICNVNYCFLTLFSEKILISHKLNLIAAIDNVIKGLLLGVIISANQYYKYNNDVDKNFPEKFTKLTKDISHLKNIATPSREYFKDTKWSHEIHSEIEKFVKNIPRGEIEIHFFETLKRKGNMVLEDSFAGKIHALFFEKLFFRINPQARAEMSVDYLKKIHNMKG